MARHAFSVRLGGIVLGGALALGVAGLALAAEESVTIEGFAFDPAGLTLTVGDSVTWTNNDGVPHTASADGGGFDTGNIVAGATASVTFDAAGTFAYHCNVHPDMRGTITVQAAGSGGGAGTTQPPTDTAGVTAERPSPATGGPELLTLLLLVAGVGGLWLGGVFARERIRRD
jgi:plastocyanin